MCIISIVVGLYSLPYMIYRKVSTPAIRVSRVSQFCTSNLKYFYIKAELDVHLAIRWVGYDGQEVDCLSSWRYVRIPALLT